MLKGKKILLGVTGSIAAYKSALLIRLLITEGAEVKLIMTPAAGDFITPLTLGTLAKSPVLSNLFDEKEWANHVMLGRWADVMVIAPLSCNTMAKMANGICDNLLLAVYLSATCPVMVAPAMDEDMWHHRATVANLERLKHYGHRILPAEHGELASGLVGEGRMAEPESIIKELQNFFRYDKRLQGKKILISAGPTYEPIDPVRFIGNRSTGKMGVALAKAAMEMGAEVTLVMGPTGLALPAVKKLRQVETAEEMYDACLSEFVGADIAIMCAAVADYSPAEVAQSKIKKNGSSLSLELVKTKDILKTMGQQKKPGQLLVGFALETDNEEENARAKLKAKNADFIILNSLRDIGAGFGGDKNKITIFDKSGSVKSFAVKDKNDVAVDILDAIATVEKKKKQAPQKPMVK